jgi:hypothetical protein
MAKRKPRRITRKESIPLSPEVAEVLERRHRAFIEKFGIEPIPDDLVFDPSSASPHSLVDEVFDQQILEAIQAMIHPARLYAYRKTGRLVTRVNARYLTKAEREEWIDAVAEWHRLHPDPDFCRLRVRQDSPSSQSCANGQRKTGENRDNRDG